MKTDIKIGDSFSNFFTRKKKYGMCRMYLKHFKMESIKHAINVIKLPMFLASLAIRGVFYLVPVCKVPRKFLKFMHKGEALQFNAIPDGYSDAMRLCNKNLKIPLCIYQRARTILSDVCGWNPSWK